MGLWDQIQSAFDEALDLRGDARERLLRSLPGDVSTEVRQMLAAHENTGPLALEKRLLDDPSNGLPAVAGYRVIELLGHGGMGDVWRAERENPAQTVALKVLAAGGRTRDAQARFLQEQRILARLDHPGIVPLLDGGFTADGRPYLAMPYVRGEEITTWCEKRSFSLEARVRLFLEVAAAVSHAHRNLVVHRDLKPSNILVNEDGSVRLLDFGIAKLLDPGLESLTRVEWQVMTPEYAAPEQVRGEAITTATDVHGLGLLLYELLSGVKAYRGSSTAELRRQIEDVDPPPPSAAGSRPALRGDLDAIVLVALAKDPARRYGSVSEMAADLERWLKGLPVTARPPSWTDRAAKFLRRNKPAAALAAAVVLLLGALVFLSWRNARRIALERDTARAEQRRAERVSSFLTNLLLMASPRQLPEGGVLTTAELLRRAHLTAPELGGEWPALLLELEGRSFVRDGEFGQARERFEQALAEARAASPRDEALIAAFEQDLAALLARIEVPAKSIPALRASLARLREIHGETHEATAAALQSLASVLPAGAERDGLEERALRIRRRLEPEPWLGTAASLLGLAQAHFDARRFHQAGEAAAEAHRIYARALPAGHPSAMAALTLQSHATAARREYAAAAQLHQRVVEQLSQALGREAVPVAMARTNLSSTLALAGRAAEASEAAGEAYRVFAKLLGSLHPYTPNAARHWAALLQYQGHYRAALELLRTAEREQSRLASRADHAELGLIQTRIGVLLLRLGQNEAGLKQLRHTIATLRRLYPRGHVALAEAEAELAFALDDPAAAEEIFRRVLAWRQARASNRPRLAEAECGLALAVAQQKRPYDATCLAEYRQWGYADPVKLAALDAAFKR